MFSEAYGTSTQMDKLSPAEPHSADDDLPQIRWLRMELKSKRDSQPQDRFLCGKKNHGTETSTI